VTLDPLSAAVDAWNAMPELRTLRAQRDAVLALHTPGPSRWAWQICTHCGGADEAFPWPCPTAEALGVTV
jgi:hypothetical protein